MADKTWKAFERRVAASVGGRRIPVTGIDRHGADVEGGMFRYQVKLRRSLPEWLWGWLEGIRTSAQAEEATGVLVLKRPGQRDTEALVVLSWADWVQLHGSGQAVEPATTFDAVHDTRE